MHTAPAYLPAKESGWYLLCADCYRAVLEREAPEESALRASTQKRQHGR